LYGSTLNSVIINRVEEVAAKHKVSMAQIGIAWILSKDVVAAPIVGSTKLENLYDIIGESMPVILGMTEDLSTAQHFRGNQCQTRRERD
jgi:aryl-alcohol dehydrogenase-like predicted oxidoreductase